MISVSFTANSMDCKTVAFCESRQVKEHKNISTQVSAKLAEVAKRSLELMGKKGVREGKPFCIKLDDIKQGQTIDIRISLVVQQNIITCQIGGCGYSYDASMLIDIGTRGALFATLKAEELHSIIDHHRYPEGKDSLDYHRFFFPDGRLVDLGQEVVDDTESSTESGSSSEEDIEASC